MIVSRRMTFMALAIFFLSLIFFLVHIQFPTKHCFDEFHYVPSAKQFLQLKENQNWEHPPLGKLLMAGGIALWGDRPLGWRFMSTVFGAGTLVGMFILAWVLFRKEEAALWVAGVTLFNQLLYVQARIGMLDTFMFGFLIWAMVAFCAAWDPQIKAQECRKLFYWAGAMFGLSMACKWFACVGWMSCLGLFLVVRILQSWQVTFASPNPLHEEDWYHPNLWKGLRTRDWVLSLVILPVLVYFLTFIPYIWIPGSHHSSFLGFLDLLKMQTAMWSGQLRVVSSHPYMSHWFDWPLLGRPIWYAFDHDQPSDPAVRGVILLGNPLVMWAGLAAVGLCIREWISFRNRNAFLISFFYFAFFACWLLIPRKILFYYYYYPSGMMLSLALGYAFFQSRWAKERILKTVKTAPWIFLGATLILFIYFFPILAALKIPGEAFRQWMWFRSWI